MAQQPTHSPISQTAAAPTKPGRQTRTGRLKTALSGACLRRSLTVGLVVGTILNVINQWDAITGAVTIAWIKGALTYSVPFAVSTYVTWARDPE